MFPDLDVPLVKAALIASVHNSLCGHHGVERTIKKLKTAGHDWPFLRPHVRKYNRECPLCQKISQIKRQIHASPFTTSSYTPMEVINMDYIGPYPDGGYVLVLLDCYCMLLTMLLVNNPRKLCYNTSVDLVLRPKFALTVVLILSTPLYVSFCILWVPNIVLLSLISRRRTP